MKSTPLHLACLIAVTGAVGGTSLLGETQSVPSKALGERNHYLFVGPELFIREGKDLTAIRRIDGNSAVLDRDGLSSISLRKTGGINWRMTTKVSAIGAQIDVFKTEAIRSADFDSFIEQSRLQNALFDQAEVIQRNASALSAQSAEASTMANSSDPLVAAAGAALEKKLSNDISEAQDDLADITELRDSTFENDDLATGRNAGNANALDVSLRISSPVPLEEAYLFISIRLLVEGRLRDTSFYRHVNSVGPKPRKIGFILHDFPAGFEIREAKIYLFSHGLEIPTNLSEKHYEVTSEEAKEFLRLSHLGDHARKSVPALPAWSLPPPGLFAIKNPGTIDFPLTIELDREGNVTKIHESELIIPESVMKLVSHMTFLPALRNGTPVTSKITVNPADFYRR
jgi:hypothetical protein